MGYKNDDPCLKKAFDDEKIFVLMARDPYAPLVVVEWIKYSLDAQPPEKLHEALDAAIEMSKRCNEMNARKIKSAKLAKLTNKLSARKKFQSSTEDPTPSPIVDPDVSEFNRQIRDTHADLSKGKDEEME